MGSHQELDIGWAEAVAVKLGLHLALHEGLVSATSHAGQSLLVRSDNQGVVAVINGGRSRSRNTNSVLKHIYKLLSRSQLTLYSVYVLSRANISDALSRGDVAGFLAGFPSAVIHSTCPLPLHLADKLIPV